MEFIRAIVNGRARNAYEKYGVVFVREGYDIPIVELEKFEKKVHACGYNKSQMVAKLVQGFNSSSGCGEQVKDPGVLFEYRAGDHIKEAVSRVMREVFHWNEN